MGDKVRARYLLSEGTSKMGKTIHSWSLQAGTTCPGKSKLCYDRCYARHGRFVTLKVRKLMRWRMEQSKQADWVDRMVDELFRRGVMVCRIHVAGDFVTPEYTARWIQIAARSPQVRFFAFTRSWRIAEIEPMLRTLACLSNVRLWYSADSEMGMPQDIPPQVRVTWLQTKASESVSGHLVFQVRELRRMALPLAVPVCPQETPEGKARGVICANCKTCFE